MESKKHKISLVYQLVSLIVCAAVFTGCDVGEFEGNINDKQEDNKMNGITSEAGREDTGMNRLPQTLAEIPNEYYQQANSQGVLHDLYYETYESMSYALRRRVLTKHAVVYIPYGYSQEVKYDVFYLMHGGWSNETTYLGTPDAPSEFKNVLDNAMAQGKIRPMIIVCPTYNNTRPSDSGDYNLAIELTGNYHNELVNDLILSVEGKYSTYGGAATTDDLKASRDHRAFCGFSMGSVATWRTFENCLDYFRYFLPSSGSLTTNGGYLASIVTESGHDWNDFFIFAASGTADFAYSSFKRQIESMASLNDGVFRYGDDEAKANLYFLEKEGGVHGHSDALQYFYNGLCWIWNK